MMGCYCRNISSKKGSNKYMFTPSIVPLKDIKRVNNSWKTSPKIKKAARKMVVFFFHANLLAALVPICDVGWWERREEVD